MEEKHTNGRLTVSGIRRTMPNGERFLRLLSNDGRELVLVSYSDRTPKHHVESHADARRLCAAWNATLDVPVAELEQGDFLTGGDKLRLAEERHALEMREAARAIDQLRQRARVDPGAALARVKGAHS